MVFILETIERQVGIYSKHAPESLLKYVARATARDFKIKPEEIVGVLGDPSNDNSLLIDESTTLLLDNSVENDEENM